MTNAYAHCPLSAPRCGYSGIFLVCSIQVHPLGIYPFGRLLVDWACSGLASGHMTPLHHTISNMAGLRRHPMYIGFPGPIHVRSCKLCVKHRTDPRHIHNSFIRIWGDRELQCEMWGEAPRLGWTRRCPGTGCERRPLAHYRPHTTGTMLHTQGLWNNLYDIKGYRRTDIMQKTNSRA
jgi:hypothetical protein